MMTSPRVLAVALLSCCAGNGLGAVRPQLPAPPDVKPSLLDFPSYDYRASSLYGRGLNAKYQRDRLAVAAAPERIARLVEQKRLDEALTEMTALAEAGPGRVEQTLALMTDKWREFTADGARDYQSRLRSLSATIATHVSRMSREDAARVARHAIDLDLVVHRQNGSEAWRRALTEFVERYTGTQAALLAEIDLAGGDDPRQTRRKVEALLALAERHGTTVAGAKALYLAAWELHANAFYHGERPGSDQTERWLRVIDLVSALESGRYPASEWVQKAPALVSGFSDYQPKYSAANVVRVTDAIVGFARRHLDGDLRSGDMVYLMTAKLPKLFGAPADAAPAMERVFARLVEEGVAPAAVHFLRVQYYLRPTDGMMIGVGDAGKSIAALDVLRADGPPYDRYALATLAGLQLFLHDYPRARRL